MKTEIIRLNAAHNATLTRYLRDGDTEYQTIGKRPAIIVIPGGGYEMCSEREADPVAMAYFQAGYQTFIPRYAIQGNKTWEPDAMNVSADAATMLSAVTLRQIRTYADLPYEQMTALGNQFTALNEVNI